MATMKFRLLLYFLAVNCAYASDSSAILALARQHAQQFSAHTHGQAEIVAGPIDSSRLPDCNALEAFSPPGMKSMGRTHVGIRCQSPYPWSILVPVKIAVFGQYLTTARAISAGEQLAPEDLTEVTGDLGLLPAGTVQSVTEAVGKTLRNSVGAGRTLRLDQLRSPLVIQQGQQVKVRYIGTGFSASADGKALNRAAVGDMVRVRMPGGRTISGTAKEDGTIEINN